MVRKYLLAGGLILATGLMFSGCILNPGGANQQVEDINVTLSGKLQAGRGGEIFVLQTSDGKIVELHNGAAKLEGYVGQEITVVGQYSGTTLYVDQINPVAR